MGTQLPLALQQGGCLLRRGLPGRWAHLPREVRRMRQHLSGASAKLAPHKSRSAWPAFFAFLVFVVGACGSTSSAPASQTTHFPLTITKADGSSVTIAKQPHRIVSLSPTATEM